MYIPLHLLNGVASGHGAAGFAPRLDEGRGVGTSFANFLALCEGEKRREGSEEADSEEFEGCFCEVEGVGAGCCEGDDGRWGGHFCGEEGECAWVLDYDEGWIFD